MNTLGTNLYGADSTGPLCRLKPSRFGSIMKQLCHTSVYWPQQHGQREPLHVISTKKLRCLCDPAPNQIIDRIQWDEASFNFADAHRWPRIWAPDILTKHACLQWQILFRCNPYWRITGTFSGNVRQQKRFGCGHFLFSHSEPPPDSIGYHRLSMQSQGIDYHPHVNLYNFCGIDSKPWAFTIPYLKRVSLPELMVPY